MPARVHGHSEYRLDLPGSMSTLNFTASQAHTLGIELELQILNTRDYNLTGASGDLLELVKNVPHPGEIKPELTESMIEISTSIQRGYGGALAELKSIRDALVREARSEEHTSELQSPV